MIKSMTKAVLGVAAMSLLVACGTDQTADPVSSLPIVADQGGGTVPSSPQMVPSETPTGTPGITAGSLEDFQTNVGDRVFFDYDRATLDDRGRDVLRRQAAWLQRYSSVTLLIEGHCDERGTREYNLALGARRATAVKEYLATLGVIAARLDTTSYGKERPVCVASDQPCWELNRRAVSTIKTGIPGA